MRNTLPKAMLAEIQSDVLTFTCGNERVTLDPSKPWPEFQATELKIRDLLERAIAAHDACHNDGDGFERATEVYGEHQSR